MKEAPIPQISKFAATHLSGFDLFRSLADAASCKSVETVIDLVRVWLIRPSTVFPQAWREFIQTTFDTTLFAPERMPFPHAPTFLRGTVRSDEFHVNISPAQEIDWKKALMIYKAI